MTETRLTGNLAQRILQRVLHGLSVRLALPAAKRAAVILHTQCDPHRIVTANRVSALQSSNISPIIKRLSGNSITMLPSVSPC